MGLCLTIIIRHFVYNVKLCLLYYELRRARVKGRFGYFPWNLYLFLMYIMLEYLLKSDIYQF